MPKTVTTNELKKGTEIRLKDGRKGILADNKKGNVRSARVENMFNRDLTYGSVYSHDIVSALVDGDWIPVEHTANQKKCRAMNKALFG